jgi:hypothetical protein
MSRWCLVRWRVGVAGFAHAYGDVDVAGGVDRGDRDDGGGDGVGVGEGAGEDGADGEGPTSRHSRYTPPQRPATRGG